MKLFQVVEHRKSSFELFGDGTEWLKMSSPSAGKRRMDTDVIKLIGKCAQNKVQFISLKKNYYFLLYIIGLGVPLLLEIKLDFLCSYNNAFCYKPSLRKGLTRNIRINCGYTKNWKTMFVYLPKMIYLYNLYFSWAIILPLFCNPLFEAIKLKNWLFTGRHKVCKYNTISSKIL